MKSKVCFYSRCVITGDAIYKFYVRETFPGFSISKFEILRSEIYLIYRLNIL